MALTDDNGGSAADLIGEAGAGAAAGAGAGSGDAGAGAAGGDGGAGAGAGAGEGQGTAGADPDWYANLSAEAAGDEPSLRDWAKARGYKTLDDVVKSARDSQKAFLDSGKVKVPGDDAKPEEVAAFRKAIGVPDDAKGYKLPEIKDAAGNPVEFNTGKLEAIAALAHENGIPAKALEATLQKIAENDVQEMASLEADIQRRASEHAKKWGDKEAENTANINAAAKALGLTRDELLKVRAAWGPERALDVFAKLGAGISEDTMTVGDGKTRFGISGAEAQRSLDTKRADGAWVAKAMTPGTPEAAEYARLNDAVAAEAERRARAG